MALSCGSLNPTSNNSNFDSVVMFSGRAEIQKIARYISEDHLRSLLDRGNDTVMIFSADWCNSCCLTRQVIIEANLKTKVYYLDLDEPWVTRLADVMGIKTIPAMFHTRQNGKFLVTRIGPSSIISYLVNMF